MQLNQATVIELEPAISVPKYDRTKVTPGILHVGVGNFHRSHQAVYLQDILNNGGNPRWGLRGAGVRPSDAIMRTSLSKQDWLSSVVEIDGDNLKVSVIGSMVDFVPVRPNGHEPLVSAMSDPGTKIVSLTVTEGGYFLNAATNSVDLTLREMEHDRKHPEAPSTIFGAIVSALKHRRSEGEKPFTVLSCDNLPGNGDIARDVILKLASSLDPDLGKWIEEAVSFPNGVVDRITPSTSDQQRLILKKRFGLEDSQPVFCEPFRQWVLEDRFVNGRPELESVGVTFTDNVHNYEMNKIRILNGSHAILAYASALLDKSLVHDAMSTPLLRDFLTKVVEDDVLPIVPEVSGFTPMEYLRLSLRRFENVAVADQIGRLCEDGVNRQPKFIVPSIMDNLASLNIPKGLALSSALWCHYCAGFSDSGKEIQVVDPLAHRLKVIARQAKQTPIVWLEQDDVYGSLAGNQGFRSAFESALAALNHTGTAATLKGYLEGGPPTHRVSA